MADIFISYASEDRSKVKPLAKALADHGCSVWWDRDLPYGLPFDELIRTELRAAGCVVALWTENSANSLYVIGEARDALRLKKLISVFLSLSRAELPYDLQAIHGVELIDWHGDRSNADYQRLVRGITAMVGRSPEKKAKAETGHKTEEEAKKAYAETKRKADEEEQRAEAERKAEEERKKKEIEAKRREEKPEIKPDKPEPDIIRRPEPKPKTKAPTELRPSPPIPPKSRKVSNALIFGAVAGIIVLLMTGGWFYFKYQQEQ